MGNKEQSTGHLLRVSLMGSSILLLVLLQGFWLVNSYEQSFVGFQREASALFRSTVFAMRDSVFSGSFDVASQLGTDGLPRKIQIDTLDSAVVKLRKGDVRIQLRGFSEPNDTGESGRTHVVDSVARRRNIFIRVKSDDTLSMNALQQRFRNVINHSAYPYPFIIRHIKSPIHDMRFFAEPDIPPFDLRHRHPPAKTFSDTVITERATIGPIHAYVAVFPGMRSNVIEKIMPQILFSIFLTTITIAAFVVMYKNLRTQERVMQMKNDFISNVTHELKTPIATVSVALEALKDFHALKNPARTAEYLDIAQHELNRLSLMTDKILNASVFEQNGVAFVPGMVKLDDIVRDVVASLKVVLDKKSIQSSIRLTGNSFEIQVALCILPTWCTTCWTTLSNTAQQIQVSISIWNRARRM
jgi:two-component system phosphate regulon sensor histidine kinase PhoR